MSGMSMSEKLAQEEAAAQEEGDVLNFDDLDTNHDGAISRNELMDADEDQSHFTRASGGDEIPTKCEALCGREKGQSLRWKARRASARTFGVTVGLLVPCLFSVTLLGRDEYFRGSASSARQLIWNAEHRDPDDLFATITPEQVRTELDTGYARCGDDEPDCVERKDLNRTMTPQCWTRLQNQAQLQDSCGETNFTCKEAARVAWNRQCRVQPGVGVGVLSHNYTFYEHMMNNPWAVIFATFMFWVLYGLWYKIIMNATMEAHLEKFIAEVYEQSLKVAEHTLDATATVAGKVADTAGSVVDKAANLAGTDTELEKQGVISQWASKSIAKRDKEEQMKNGKRAFAIFIFVVTLGAALLTVYALIEGNAGNRYGLKIMDALGNIRIQSGQAAGEAGHNGSATKKMLSFGMGMIVAGGLVGAPTLTSFADKDTERRPVGKHKYWPLIGFFAFGIPFGLLCMWCEMELDQAEHHVLDSALNDDVRSRADIALKYQDPTYGEDKPPGYFAVQFSKLYREREHGFRTDMVQTLMCAVISLCWDVFVVTYHVIKPPHPKHRLRTDRRLSIYTHVFSGMGEIICSLASFWLYDEGLQNNDLRLRLTYMQVLCSYTHAWTGAFQTPQVFGMQCVMVPAYGVVVLWKVVCATRLALDPESLVKLIELFFIHHIYVWCRAFVFIFEGIGIFEEATYTVAIMFAGFVCGPMTIGPAGNLLVMAVVSIYCFCLLPYKHDPESSKIERRLNMFLNARWRHHISKLQKRLGVQQINQMATAESVIERRETVKVQVPQEINISKDCPRAEEFQEFVEKIKADESTMTEEEALDKAEAEYDGPMVKIGSKVTKVNIKVGDIVQPGEVAFEVKDRAPEQGYPDKKTIFKALDQDRNGYLDRDEVANVLVSWGVGPGEALEIFDQLDGLKESKEDTVGKVTEEEFYEEWEPIWQYQVDAIENAINKYRNFQSNDIDRGEYNKGSAKLKTAAHTLAHASSSMSISVGEKSMRNLALQEEVEERAKAKKQGKPEAGKKGKKQRVDDVISGAEKMIGFDQSNTTRKEDEALWDYTIGHSQEAYRPDNEEALRPHDIMDIMYSHLGCHCIPCFAHEREFLAAKDGAPGRVSYPGWLGMVDLALLVLAIPFCLVGMFNQGGDYQELCCLAGVLTLPHYFNDMLCYQAGVIALVAQQVEAKLIFLYNTLFCMSLTYIFGADDMRWVIIWTALFWGINLVAFADACTFQAMTTKRTLEIALITIAVPFLLLLWLGLRSTRGDPYFQWFPRLCVDGTCDAPGQGVLETDELIDGSASGVQPDDMSWLTTALTMLQTNLILLCKSVFNHFQNPRTAMILQMKVSRRDVHSEVQLGSLTKHERDLILKYRQMKRETSKQDELEVRTQRLMEEEESAEEDEEDQDWRQGSDEEDDGDAPESAAEAKPAKKKQTRKAGADAVLAAQRKGGKKSKKEFQNPMSDILNDGIEEDMSDSDPEDDEPIAVTPQPEPEPAA